ncbi:MAG: urea ABC transporter ATP-binding protein UrtD [Candidatus Poribacteria bacterium]|nr:urea ABC transporter ATP-binding protein UrtD [Candidatus Poribacteria bacterium]
MKHTQRIEDYKNDSPKFSRLWSERYLLFLEEITAVFDGFKALDIEALGIEHNELRVIIGPNGAGKTTLCDVVSGKTRPTTGSVYFDDAEITHESETEIVLLGIGRKFQTPTVFDSLTTYENMELALPGHQKLWPNLFGRAPAVERDRILEILERVGLAEELNREAKYLSHGQRQWLAISVLILSNPKLLLVDEPAAGLTDAETALTAELLLELKTDHTLIVIEHDMDFVRRLDSFVTVLNEGQVMAEGTLSKLQENEEVIEAYLGR